MSSVLEVNRTADFEKQVSGCKSFSYTKPRHFNRTLPAATPFPDTLNSSLCFPDNYLPSVLLCTSLHFLAALWASVKIPKSRTIALVINSPRRKQSKFWDEQVLKLHASGKKHHSVTRSDKAGMHISKHSPQLL